MFGAVVEARDDRAPAVDDPIPFGVRERGSQRGGDDAGVDGLDLLLVDPGVRDPRREPNVGEAVEDCAVRACRRRTCPVLRTGLEFNSRQGASHCLDFLLVFGTLSPTEVAAHPHAHPNAASEFTHVADKMRTDWATFAASGDPGWAPYNPRTRTTRVYGTTATDRPYLQEPSRPIWATHRFDALELLA